MAHPLYHWSRSQGNKIYIQIYWYINGQNFIFVTLYISKKEGPSKTGSRSEMVVEVKAEVCIIVLIIHISMDWFQWQIVNLKVKAMFSQKVKCVRKNVRV